MSFTWQVEPEAAFTEFADEYSKALHTAVYQLALRYAPEIETWMKANAVWTDRTGNARQTLYSEVQDLTDSVLIAFGHGVDYGIFLELANAGRFAIVNPALDFFAPKIWADVRRLIN
jgi:hypothetical protein